MRFSTLAGAIGLLVTPLVSALRPQHHGIRAVESHNSNNKTCVTPGAVPDLQGSEIRSIGMVLFRAFDMIDVFGTLDPLQLLALTTQQLNLHLIAATLDPVTTQPLSMNKFNSSFFPVVQPTNTFDDDLDLDVLIVPGGPGARSTSLDAELAYIKKMFPKVKILMTICTGAGVAAQTGVLDGHMATTNKNAWATMTAKGPAVKWVTPARYVIDGKVWSSSGVTSALDLVFAFIERYWGSDKADYVSHIIEHTPLSAGDDGFSEYYGIEPSETQPCEE
ncbi:class I glutamine amidotransferase-like protein [Thelonectria olida]|uniref:Class I glutamine amidotransferase-like protein n=1 Tax=Thelonectria olida TaxID=1576542 RepID=A0A9P8W5T2_9HYPO|nr:class I glutamine amidotransferase-like protein [Thelonectria olida]